jgi:murein DD-endopeptidase MepM/ murein hydrolase activator NlpD
MSKRFPRKVIIAAVIILVFSFLFQIPTTEGKVTSWYGPRLTADRFFHTGSDIGLPSGTPIRPVAAGTVKTSGFTDRNGLYLVLRHHFGIESRYLHLDSAFVAAGDQVERESPIGLSGNSGLSTGPHLHYEIRLFGIPLPASLLCQPGRLVTWANKEVGVARGKLASVLGDKSR